MDDSGKVINKHDFSYETGKYAYVLPYQNRKICVESQENMRADRENMRTKTKNMRNRKMES